VDESEEKPTAGQTGEAMSTTQEVLSEIDLYLRKHRKEVNDAERARAAQGVKRWRDAYKQAKAEALKVAAAPKPEVMMSASDDLLVADWISSVNKKRVRDAERSRSGVPLAPLEIGMAPGMISPSSALEQARVWWSERVKSTAAAREAEATRVTNEQQAEQARAYKLTHEPRPASDKVWSKYRDASQPLTRAALETYSQNWNFDELRRQAEAARNIAQLEIADYMTGEVSQHEWQLATDFINTNNLDPTFASSWGLAISYLVEVGVESERFRR
jgi:hypothetical protein